MENEHSIEEARNFSNKVILGICSVVGLVMIFVGSLIFPDNLISTKICVIFVAIGAIMFFAGLTKLIIMSVRATVVSRNEDLEDPVAPRGPFFRDGNSSDEKQSLVNPSAPEQISVAIYPPLPYVVGLYQNSKIYS